MAGLNRTLHFKPRINPGGDGVRVERLQKNPDFLYHRIVVMSNGGTDVSNNPKIIGAKFPSVAELQDLPEVSDRNGDGISRRVIFFGTPFLLIHNVSPDVYVEQLNRCLDYLRRNFSGHALIYRPHPNETNEADRAELDGFRIEDDRGRFLGLLNGIANGAEQWDQWLRHVSCLSIHHAAGRILCRRDR
jgi:hypothetical protein